MKLTVYQNKAIHISFGLVKHPKALQLYIVMATTSKIYLVLKSAKGGELIDKVAKRRLKEDNARSIFNELVLLILPWQKSLQYHDLNLMEMYRKISNAN
ncbi:hypothetical protein RJ640_018751 [Escallonia rubra]|uniref:Protein kinase domain-containing protein n=1 Tax=Escallonia rubra TaxID=112253 RepID=A0AA88RGV6_9ASTE|nr:hypothetical protein RJ640_018751 [Escallonia rubra]